MFNPYTDEKTLYTQLGSTDEGPGMIETAPNIPLAKLEVTLEDNNFAFLDPFVNSFYAYMNRLIKTGKMRKYYDKVKIKYVLTNNHYDPNDILLSFVVPVKNAPSRALISIESLIRSSFGNSNETNIEIIIVEDKSSNLIPVQKLSSCDHIKYCLIDTGSDSWSRAKVLNYGIKQAKGKYMVVWDTCFLCNNLFVNNLINYVKRINFNLHIASVAVYESHDQDSHDKGNGYGNLWVYETDKIKSLNGFVEDPVMNRYEHRNMEILMKRKFRLKKTLHSMYVDPYLYVIHMSHSTSNLINNQSKDRSYNPNGVNWGNEELLLLLSGKYYPLNLISDKLDEPNEQTDKPNEREIPNLDVFDELDNLDVFDELDKLDVFDELDKLDEIPDQPKIPKIIHQIWVGPNPVPYVWINTFRYDYLKSNPDWEYMLWTDENVHTLKYLNIDRYNQEKTWNGKSDLLRFSFLKEFGGVYIDADSVSIKSKSLDPLLEEAMRNGGFFAAWEDHDPRHQTIAGGVCGSYPNHPVVNNIIQAQERRMDNYPLWPAWKTVGPLAVEEGVNNSDPTDYIIFPSIYFYPVWWHHYNQHFTEIDTDLYPNSYMYQFGYTTNGYSSSDKDGLRDNKLTYTGSILVLSSDISDEDYQLTDSTHPLYTYNCPNLSIGTNVESLDILIEECHEDFIFISTDPMSMIHMDNYIPLMINDNPCYYSIDENTYLIHRSDLYKINKELNGHLHTFDQFDIIKNILIDMTEIGYSFIIRAKNEELNLELCLGTLVPIIKNNPRVEVIFVDNGSTDRTLELALEYADKYKNIRVFEYSNTIAKTGVEYREHIKENPDTSIAKYYNWCVDLSTKNIVIKWDADFIINKDNFIEMVQLHKIESRTDNVAIWFTGETMFEHNESYYIKTNSYYDEYRVFNKNHVRWIDGYKCELLSIDNQCIIEKYMKPVFYEIKRTSIDEFSMRGDIIDKRDKEDKDMLDMLVNDTKSKYLVPFNY